MESFYQLMGSTSISETIQRRRSVRTYSGLPVPTETKDRIRQVLRELSGPFQGKIRCELIDRKDTAVNEGVKLGTYGVILGAPSFVAAAAEQSSQAMEQLGYVFEQLVLFLTSQGLGTVLARRHFSPKRICNGTASPGRRSASCGDSGGLSQPDKGSYRYAVQANPGFKAARTVALSLLRRRL